ncbi:MAG: efflux transporter outer membrane subunit, partial [Limisphaera sp.]|nr:efflux transporter outer membrane subunit [Limisphaera sp.]
MRGETTRPRQPSNSGLTPDGATLGLLALIAASALALTGCTVGPDYAHPRTRVASTFVQGNAPQFTHAPVDVTWWRNFRDPTLDRLIQAAVTGNPDLRLATARLREARALRRMTDLDLLPTVQAAGGFSKSVRSADAMPGVPRPRRESELYEAGLDAFWELDLWGRVRRSVEAARAEVAAVEAGRREVLLSLLAEVARNYCELRGLQVQLSVAQQNARLQSESLEIVRAKLEAGRATELDLSRARAQYEATLAAIPTLETAVHRTLYRLSVLTGQPPEALEPDLASPGPLPEVPPLVHIGNPAELLRRRPDIQAAERSLAAATARIGVATADLFPRVT